MAELLNGKPVADKISEEISNKIRILKKGNIEPTLAIVRLGERVDDLAYEKSVIKRCDILGIQVVLNVFDEKVEEETLLMGIDEINKNKKINGALIFRPLPCHINEDKICNVLDPIKDIDGITDFSMAGIFKGKNIGYPPCTAAACMELLDFYKIDIKGKNVAIVGRSLVIGKPVAMLLMKKDATVTICHSKTKELPELVRRADIVVVAIGKARSMGEESFSKEQVVLDVGIHVTPQGEVCGDVNFNNVAPIIKSISPVPGGVGSVTTAILLKHLVEAAERQKNL